MAWSAGAHHSEVVLQTAPRIFASPRVARALSTAAAPASSQSGPRSESRMNGTGWLWGSWPAIAARAVIAQRAILRDGGLGEVIRRKNLGLRYNAHVNKFLQFFDRLT